MLSSPYDLNMLFPWPRSIKLIQCHWNYLDPGLGIKSPMAFPKHRFR